MTAGMRPCTHVTNLTLGSGATTLVGGNQGGTQEIIAAVAAAGASFRGVHFYEVGLYTLSPA
jgi:hypothetical protein